MQNQVSNIRKFPRSRIIKKGYINIYSVLTPEEHRYYGYLESFKNSNPAWDFTLIRLLQYFRDGLPKDAKLLDIGCGHGNYLIDECRKKILWAVGVDVDKPSTDKNICLDEIIITRSQKLPFPDNSFDGVTILWVMEHLSNPNKTISEVYRVLKPHGKIYFATPNKHYILIVIKRLFEHWRIDKKMTSFLYGRREKDIFPAMYAANDIATVNKLLTYAIFSRFKIDENFDPGYTSFNELSFKVTKLIYRCQKLLNLSLFNAHILGWAEK